MTDIADIIAGQERWRPIEECPQYDVSNLGRVRRRLTGRILKPSARRSRKTGPITHYAVNLGRRLLRVHRLVRGSNKRTWLGEDEIRCIQEDPHFRGVNQMLGRCFGVGYKTIERVRRLAA